MTAMELVMDLQARKASSRHTCSMEGDWCMVTECVLVDGRFVDVKTWLFDYRGQHLLSEDL